jgi:asparagine N-glycosylation enzyme membrane subunit Stt3
MDIHLNIVPYGMIYIIFAVERKTTKEKEFFIRFPAKRTVIIVAALLLVVGVGTAFAADGISLNWRNNTVYISNSNSRPYNVTVQIIYSANGMSGQTTQRSTNVKAGKTGEVSIASSAIIEHAEVISASPGF